MNSFSINSIEDADAKMLELYPHYAIDVRVVSFTLLELYPHCYTNEKVVKLKLMEEFQRTRHYFIAEKNLLIGHYYPTLKLLRAHEPLLCDQMPPKHYTTVRLRRFTSS